MEFKIHPIIDRPHEYDIAEFRYFVGLEGEASFIDLVLRRNDSVRRLRFLHPRDLQIEEGCFPAATRGMEIRDVRGHHLSDIGVQVADIEGSRGAITFWARDVIDLDDLEHESP